MELILTFPKSSLSRVNKRSPLAQKAASSHREELWGNWPSALLQVYSLQIWSTQVLRKGTMPYKAHRGQQWELGQTLESLGLSSPRGKWTWFVSKSHPPPLRPLSRGCKHKLTGKKGVECWLTGIWEFKDRKLLKVSSLKLLNKGVVLGARFPPSAL